MAHLCDQQLWSRSVGDGPPVLLLHGLGASAHYWDRVLPLVSGNRLTAPDLLGFGRSPAPGEAAYDVDCHLTALEPFVRPGMVVVGHSTGSMLATAFAAAHPREVRAIVLVSLPAYPDEKTAKEEIGRISLLARLTIEERLSARVICEAMCHVRPLAVAAAPILVRDLPRKVAADGARHTWASYSRTLKRVVAGHSVLPDLRQIDCPISILHSRHDELAPLRHVESLLNDLPGARLEVVDGDHHLPVRRPDVVARVVRRACAT